MEKILSNDSIFSQHQNKSEKIIKKVRFTPDTKDNETKSSISVEITHADIIEV